MELDYLLIYLLSSYVAIHYIARSLHWGMDYWRVWSFTAKYYGGWTKLILFYCFFEAACLTTMYYVGSLIHVYVMILAVAIAEYLSFTRTEPLVRAAKLDNAFEKAINSANTKN